VLDVGEQQLLMLLLVVESELDHAMCGMLEVTRDAADERVHVLVHVRAVCEHLLDRWPRD
jgi:uncharacterized protein YunC (DUF1805 family)